MRKHLKIVFGIISKASGNSLHFSFMIVTLLQRHSIFCQKACQ
jgi:hypothetical protein